VPIGVLCGIASAIGLGSIAVKVLARRGPEMLQALATSPAGRR